MFNWDGYGYWQTSLFAKTWGRNGWMVLLKFKSRTQSIFKQFYAMFMFSQD